MKNRIDRKNYLEWLKTNKDKQIIKVVSGVRRCGKSTLFDIYKDWLKDNGVLSNQIISINFEDIENEQYLDYKLLYNHVKEKLNAESMNYIFFDEIQHVKEYEKVVDSLFIKENCDVYITGSNAYFMSGELATMLTGRYIELRMLPLSYKEFCSAFKDKSNTYLFNLYLEKSSFPYLSKYDSTVSESRDYLNDIYNSILFKDVVARLKVSDVTTLENVTKYLLHNVGNIVSPTKIANTLKSSGKGADQKTIDKYIKGLTDSLLMYEVKRYNLKGKMFLNTNSKYYAVDLTLRNVLVRGSDSDIGHILENIVYLELRRRGFDVYVGQLSDGEIDFVAVNGDEISYYQVSASTLDENTLKRELAPFDKISDHYPKYLLTLDEMFGTANYNGIKKINVLEWLLE